MDTQEIKAFTPKFRDTKNRWQNSRYPRLQELLKLPQRGKPLLEAINKGFSVKLLRDATSNLSINIYKVGTYIDIKKSTLNRRLREGTLTTAESDRFYRFVEVYDLTLDLFNGDKIMAYQWLNSPAAGLSGELPINLIRTSAGSNDVLSLISKIEHGVLI
jgi:putative toxin-antitoxin system antitoxin component (TIGR02293 family)